MSGSDQPAEATPPGPSSTTLFLLSPDAPSWSNDASNSSLVGSPPVSDSPASVLSNVSESTVASPPPDSSSPVLSPPPESPLPSPPPPPPASQPPKSSPASSLPPPLPQSPTPASPPPVFFPPPALSSPPPPVAPNSSPPPSTPQQSSPPSPTQPLSPPPFPPPPSDSSPAVPLIPPPPLLFVPPPPIEQNSPATDSSPPADYSTTTFNPTNNPTSSSSNINNSASASVALVPPSHSNTKSPSSSSTSTSSSSKPVESTPSSSTAEKTTVIGAVVAGVIILALISTIFVLSWKKKRRPEAYPAQYVPPPNFAVQSDGYYYGQNSSIMAVPGQSGPFFPSRVPHSGNSNSFASQTGNVYQVGGLDSELLTGAKSFYSYEEVMEMTSGFTHQNIIGEGGFGSVYKGQLPDGRVVAVKQLKAGSGQGDREFRAEVEIISRVHHRHLVSLVGYCIQDNQRLLIYEFLPNKTLDYHLHGKDQPVLDWEKRLRIAVGSAKGLAYLHEDCNPKIIHRDIKSSNILLDDAFEAQVSDFGLAKLANDTNTHVSTRVMGTFGYLAPEYASSGKLTDRSDVFSFGVVLLELITGRKPVDATQPFGDESLVEWSRPLLVRALETGELSEVVDPRLQKHYVESEMLRMIEAAAACIRHSATKRPRMAQVVRALDTDGEMSDLTNGVKYGQSTIYNSGQYSEDILKFRMMALDCSDSLDLDPSSRDHTSKEVPTTASWRSRDSSSDFTSDSESRAFNPGSSRKR